MKNTCYIIPVMAVMACLSSCSHPKNTAQNQVTQDNTFKVKIKGSETIRPVIEKIDDDYMALHPNVFIDYTGGGSNIGLLSFLGHEADIAFVSRELSADEKQKLKDNHAVIDSFALDGLAIIVNLNNPVKSLSISQLRDIYSGRINNWQEVGGSNWPIILYSRDISSGTYSFFKNKVLDSLDYSKDDINLTHNEEIINNVANTKNAVGYVGLSYTNRPNIKTVPLVFSDHDQPQAPNFQNIGSNSYHLKRYVLLIHHQDEKGEVAGFIHTLKDQSSLKVINEAGLIPVKNML